MALTITQKLKIKDKDRLLVLHAPANFEQQLAPLPSTVKIVGSGKLYNQIHWFVKNKKQVDNEAGKILAMMKEDTTCWIYFPKGSSGLQTDLSRDRGWDVLHAEGTRLSWLSLVSFDDTWSAFAFRLNNEPGDKKAAAPPEKLILQYADSATKTVRLPEDVATAFKKNKPAATFFESLAYSNRKEYIEWIITAKQEDTRSKRISGTIERLEKNWKNPRNQ